MHVPAVIRKPTKLNLAEKYRQGNVEAAKIIIANTTGRYEGLVRAIAERTLAQEAAYATNQRVEVLLADEPGGQLDLFDGAVGCEGGSSCQQR